MADLINSVSSAPYDTRTYSAESNSKNTLTIESYFKLLAAQLANQDMTNPMDNSEMMAQMTQMAMVQSLGTMTTNMKEQMAFSKSSYLTNLIGRQVTAKVPTDKNDLLAEDSTKTGVIESVNMSSEEPTFRLKGDITEYPLENLLEITGGSAATMVSEPGAAVISRTNGGTYVSPSAAASAENADSSTGPGMRVTSQTSGSAPIYAGNLKDSAGSGSVTASSPSVSTSSESGPSMTSASPSSASSVNSMPSSSSVVASAPYVSSTGSGPNLASTVSTAPTLNPTGSSSPNRSAVPAGVNLKEATEDVSHGPGIG